MSMTLHAPAREPEAGPAAAMAAPAPVRVVANRNARSAGREPGLVRLPPRSVLLGLALLLLAALLLALGYPAGKGGQASGRDAAEAAAARRAFDQRAQAALAFAPPYGDFITGGAQAAGHPLAADLQY